MHQNPHSIQNSSPNTRSRLTRRLLRWLLGIIAVVAISLLYPNNLRFPFEFERGQTWRYSDLDAPYDIPVLKTPETLDAEIREVEQVARPVYRMDQDIARNARAEFLREFQISLDSAKVRGENKDLIRNPERHRRYGLRILDKLYDQGIIRARSEEEVDGMATLVTILNGNEQRERTLAQLRTPGDARAWLRDSLFYTDLKSPEFLLDLLEDRFNHNLFYSDSLTQKLKADAIASVSPYDDLIRQGESIIKRGETVTGNVYQQLVSYRRLYNESLSTQTTFWSVFGGYAVQIGLVVLLLIFYIRSFFPLIYSRTKNLVFILMWLVLYALLVRTLELSPDLSTYLVPFCIVPIVIRIFFNERLAFFVHVVVVLTASFLTTLGYHFVFLSIMAGVVVIVMDIDTRDYGRFLRSLLLLFAFYFVGFIGLELMRGGTWNTVNYKIIAWIGLNVFLCLLSIPLIPVLERIFGFISPITLGELSDMNRPLLEKLARQAAGTWQHSLNVANMAEQAARAIGADALLVKTAALYHDVGKITNPGFFIENQSGPNPHEKLGPKESAAIIIGHVNEGIKLARQAKLPEVLIDFIRTHHGTTRAEFFYRNYIKDHPEREAEEADFRYPGPRPATKEQTILMLADSTEAASKSLKNPSKEELYDLIDGIIRGKLGSGQLEFSRLTFHELEACRSVFRSFLQSVHQVRIAYPEEE
ncbi:HD family phosphohydrolase [Neolewinella aurantiaca]|uniref:HD family phosphohydrolase n=1 Tax=Neolewinella aurantiaca TaxID=2602767 RepID=UPI00164FBFC8|nr:HDIG domain-containing metalloprotein [Neolewinella aurantiaca]